MMNFNHLYYFVMVAECKSITLAAKMLHIAQPPLSRQLALLEKNLGVSLFNRSNKGVDLTHAGKLLFDKAKGLLRDIENITEMIKETDRGIRGIIRIGTVYSDLPIIARELKKMHALYPLIQYHLTCGAPMYLADWLEASRFDILFMRTPTFEIKTFRHMFLAEEPLVLVMHRNVDPCPELTEMEIEHLRSVPLCLLNSGKYWGHNEYLLSKCRDAGFEPHVPYLCNDTAVALALTKQGLGIAYQPQATAESICNEEVYIKPIKGLRATTHPVLLWRDEDCQSRITQLFLELFQASRIENEGDLNIKSIKKLI